MAQSQIRSTPSRKRCETIHLVKAKYLTYVFINKLNPSILTMLSTVLVLITTLISATPQPVETTDKCYPPFSDLCLQIPNFKTVQPFSNTLGHSNIESARKDLNKYLFLMGSKCPKKEEIILFLCSLFFPVCINNHPFATEPLPPCRETCEDARECEEDLQRALNITWPEDWRCDNFARYTEKPLCFMKTNNTNRSGANSGPNPTLTPQDYSNLRTYTSDHMLEHNYGTTTEVPMEIDPLQTTTQSPPEPICDNLFNCKFADPTRPMCIDHKFVCDGKIDCKGSPDPDQAGLDEKNCSNIVQKTCDGPECQATSLIELVPLIVSVLGLIIVVIRILSECSPDSDKPEDSQSEPVSYEERFNTHTQMLESHSPSLILVTDQYKEPLSLNKMISPLEQHLPISFATAPPISSDHLHDVPQPPESMYQEVSTRGDNVYNYERILPGGYSGTSSIYASGSFYGDDSDMGTIRSARERDFRERDLKEPIAPPPSPSTEGTGESFSYS